jgi:BirA family biotin operon repressor/biotin-[acetyl-CoA-carboxylase] ligase
VNPVDPPEDRLDVTQLARELGPLAPFFATTILPCCDSSSSVLLEQAAAGAPRGAVVVCEQQTAGRGRRGRNWLAEPGGSLAFSLLWRFGEGASQPIGLSLAVGVAVARALEGWGLRPRLKWPNDVLLDQRKLAGILIELASGKRGGVAAVIGIGVNLRLAPDSPVRAWGAADLAGVLNPLPGRNALLAALLRELLAVLETFGRHGFAGLRDAWLARHAHQDANVLLTPDVGQPIEGRARGVDHEGALLIDTAAGVQRVISGDVSLRPA